MSSRHLWREFMLRIFWYGGSTFDAWLNIASIKVASRLLTIPYATAQLGLPSAITFQLLQAFIGIWCSCAINILYLRHRSNTVDQDGGKHTTQLHEVIGGLLGPRWGAVSLCLNIGTLSAASAHQLVACANIVYILNDNLDKRTWILIFGAILSMSIFTPTARNFRVWSFLGVLTTVYASCYLTIASISHGKASNAQSHSSSPQSYSEYFSGISGYIVLGHIQVPVETMDAMWKPQEFPVAYLYGILYMLVVVMPSSMSVYVMFGDEAHKYINALELFPASTFRNAVVVLMLVHQFIMFGVFSLGLHTMWEKLLRVHNSSTSYAKRMLCRVPVFLALWLAALAFPFFGRMNSLLGSSLVAWSLYVLPCTAYIKVFFWRDKKNLPSLSRLGWAADFSINLGIILWVAVVESGLGFWGSLDTFLQHGEKPRLFARCDAC